MSWRLSCAQGFSHVQQSTWKSALDQSVTSILYCHCLTMSYNGHYYSMATPPHAATPPGVVNAPPSCYYAGYYEGSSGFASTTSPSEHPLTPMENDVAMVADNAYHMYEQTSASTPCNFSAPSSMSTSSATLSASSRFGPESSRRKCGSNKKERRRTQSINNAFASLRDCIPNVPCDTKLSKIKTLRLATSYIDYLMGLLNDENPGAINEGFKADINKKWNEKSEEQKRRELEAELNNNNGGNSLRVRHSKGGARTGWPQTVWALELKH